MKTVAVLMTCFNRVRTTLRCLENLFSQAVPADVRLDVWLVDDASPDSTGRIVRERFPRVHVVFSPGGLYWCKGMRCAWDHASAARDYDFYLWLNDDVRLFDGALRGLFDDVSLLRRRIGSYRFVVAGSFYGSPGGGELSYGVLDEKAKAIKPDPDGPRRGFHVFSGNLVLVPGEVFAEVGPICGKFDHAWGDFDYAETLTDHGIPFFAASGASGWCSPKRDEPDPLKNRPLFKRLHLLVEPKGYNLHDAFLYRYRHKGLFRACLSFVHVFFMVLRGR